MPELLLVEGLTDAAFFQEIFARLYFKTFERVSSHMEGRRNMPAGIQGTTRNGADLEVQFRYFQDNEGGAQGGKDKIPRTTSALLDGGIRKFAVAQDIDDGSPEDVVQSIRDVVTTHLNLPSELQQASAQIDLPDGIITVLPMGLHENQTLTNLGISKHEMEDYLIMLALEDPSLRQNVPELSSLLANILPTVREFEGDFNSSKELFQLIKPMIQHGFSDTGVVQKLVRDADKGILRTVLAPLLIDVEQAFGL